MREAPEKPKIHIRVCRHFMGELSKVASEPEFADIVAESFPSFCDHPQKKRGPMQEMALRGSEDFETIVVLGGCFSGDLEVARDGVKLYKVDQCFHLFAGRDTIDDFLLKGRYLMTPGWLSEWRRTVERWGFDRDTAREFFAECSTGILLLDTGIDPECGRHLAEFSSFVGLPAETLKTGLDYFRLYLRHAVSEKREELYEREIRRAFAETDRREADYAMALELLQDLARSFDETEVIERIIETFMMLFDPERLLYLPLRVDRVHEADSGFIVRTGPHAHDGDGRGLETLEAEFGRWANDTVEKSAWAENGFFIRFMHRDEGIGALAVANLGFPQYTRRYLNLASSISGLCGLVIENARLFGKVEELANKDALTGLNTRRHFFELASADFARARRFGKELSALMFDIDYFKRINDTHGHAEGDRVLRGLGAVCRETVRVSDVCGRYGGEEFAILLTETPGETALVFAERLREAIAAIRTPEGGAGEPVRVSVGIASMRGDCASLEELLIRADHAMYAAKREGRDRCVVWTESLA